MSKEENSALPTEFSRKPDILSRQADNGSFIFNTMTNELFRVNSTGGRIWELLGEKRSIDEIAEIINSEFEGGNIERIQNSVRIFLNKLSERNLV